MSELDDLDEILLTPTRSGSAKRMRSGRRMFDAITARARLKLRLHASNRRKRPVTLAGSPILTQSSDKNA